MTRSVAVPLGLTTLVVATMASPSPDDLRFTDVTSAAGITFRHSNAASSEKYLIETMGSGAAWIDFDGDGLLDIYLANSAPTKSLAPSNGAQGRAVSQQRRRHVYGRD